MLSKRLFTQITVLQIMTRINVLKFIYKENRPSKIHPQAHKTVDTIIQDNDTNLASRSIHSMKLKA